MQLARRVEELPPYLFAEISRKIAEKRAAGVDVVSFGIGDPDLPTPLHVLEALKQAAGDPANHRYPETDGLPELRRAFGGWYERRFGVELDPDKQTLPLIGSKEGIGHVALCLIDEGDTALVPDPAYPVYAVGTSFAGGLNYTLPLLEQNGYLPDLDAIPRNVVVRAKILWLNYPNNPTGAVAGLDFFERAIDFAKRNDIVICHDLAYADVTYDEYEAPSFLQAKGAFDVGIEFNSLSKTYNMTGWRIGVAAGNEQLVNALFRVKSNLDSGVPQAIQEMAIAAMSGPQDCILDHNEIYQRRRDRIVEALRGLGLTVQPPRAGLYVWAHTPEGMSSIQFAGQLLDATGVVVTPGIGYGHYGEGYIRLSVTTPDDRVEEGLRRLAAWQIEAARAGA
ncbi:MAG TPA: LL-diaminopimelate aminotransferase [Dehalococcoidia bacterium]|nr:LL-diaminopimelate aminotransferase [Dehalococcoidia bacterium]